MILSLLILTTVRSTRRAANDLTQLGVFIVALSVVTGLDESSNLSAQDPFSAVASNLVPNTTLGAEGSDPEKRLREGTLIPSTEGRIVMLGRRWAFVPAAFDLDQAGNVVDTVETSRSLASAYPSRPRPSRLGARGESFPGNADVDRLIVGADGQGRAARGNGAPQLDVPHIVIVENLMLQRIVEAIRSDSADDRWTVTGQVTEFFNENRLMLNTAQRANTK